jgi:hypothetical protein
VAGTRCAERRQRVGRIALAAQRRDVFKDSTVMVRGVDVITYDPAGRILLKDAYRKMA